MRRHRGRKASGIFLADGFGKQEKFQKPSQVVWIQGDSYRLKDKQKQVSSDLPEKRGPPPPDPTPAGWATLEISEVSARPCLLIA